MLKTDVKVNYDLDNLYQTFAICCAYKVCKYQKCHSYFETDVEPGLNVQKRALNQWLDATM